MTTAAQNSIKEQNLKAIKQFIDDNNIDEYYYEMIDLLHSKSKFLYGNGIFVDRNYHKYATDFYFNIAKDNLYCLSIGRDNTDTNVVLIDKVISFLQTIAYKE